MRDDAFHEGKCDEEYGEKENANEYLFDAKFVWVHEKKLWIITQFSITNIEEHKNIVSKRPISGLQLRAIALIHALSLFTLFYFFTFRHEPFKLSIRTTTATTACHQSHCLTPTIQNVWITGP